MPLTANENAILTLSDAGRGPDAISRELRLSRKYVREVVRRYAVDWHRDIKSADKLRLQTRVLGWAVIAAGGHR